MTAAVPEPPHLVTDLKDLMPGDDGHRVAAPGRPGRPRAPVGAVRPAPTSSTGHRPRREDDIVAVEERAARVAADRAGLDP